ncbi:PREDICTED: prothrombin-like [Polistes canadensis]|uniref:prothrombin-like n=1 Tax=Polistes canadensis TaxID=91411 RepID=UPI000719055B|nr:PREDICTED: prothrombin-like [Polistes canadensis]
MVTSNNVRCQYWQTDQPLHKVDPNITDADFPEKSMKAAKNYCRNPTNDPRGPWCYTLDPTLIDDECDVPLCNFGSK